MLGNAQLSDRELYFDNSELKVDENRLIHIKFINLKGQLYGSVFSQTSKSGEKIKQHLAYAPIMTELSNINLEETYDDESTKNSDGKYEVQFENMAESLILAFTVMKKIV